MIDNLILMTIGIPWLAFLITFTCRYAWGVIKGEPDVGYIFGFAEGILAMFLTLTGVVASLAFGWWQ